jgi:hypothetical protein
VAKPPIAPPPPSTDGANMLYSQVPEIRAIVATQLADYAHWCRSSPTPNTAYAGVGWRGPAEEPTVARMVPSAPTGFSPKSLLGQ